MHTVLCTVWMITETHTLVKVTANTYPLFSIDWELYDFLKSLLRFFPPPFLAAAAPPPPNKEAVTEVTFFYRATPLRNNQENTV